MGARGILPNEVYDELVKHLQEDTYPSKDERQRSHVLNKVYKHINQRDYKMEYVEDPRSFAVALEKKLVISDTNKIVLMQTEVDQLIGMYFSRSKGLNAKKFTVSFPIISLVSVRRQSKNILTGKEKRNLFVHSLSTNPH